MNFVLELATELPQDVLRERLRKHEPWGHRIDFSNGVSTADLVKRTPFSENPLQKLLTVSEAIPFEQLRGGPLLDIGCNSGYNSIYAAAHHGMQVVGLDVSKRHMEVCNFLADVAGVKAEFLLGNAETFSRPGAFDVVLHFGTLYHLPNPLLALKTTFDNLKPGGWLALETQTYDHPDDPNLCYFIQGHNNDKTNFWAISEQVLTRYLSFIGFTGIQVLLKVSPPILGKHMNRVVLVARKAG